MPTLATSPPTGAQSGTYDGSSNRSNSVNPQPIDSPITPPSPVSVAASIRNCHRMSLRFAPIALRTPISRVRSVTETSMMFITPMPPTIKPTEEITTIAIARPPVIERKLSRILSDVCIPKLSSSANGT